MTTMREAQPPHLRHLTAEPSARRQATQERLIDAAVQLFGERGVPGSTVEEICDRAGFTRGAFYSNFESKDDLCLAVLQKLGERHVTAMQAAVGGGSPDGDTSAEPEELIRAAVGMFLQAQPKQAAEVIGMIEMRLHALRTPDLREGWLRVHRQMTDSVCELLETAISRVGGRLTMPTPEAMDLLHAAYEITISMALMRGEDAPGGLSDHLITLLNALIEVDPRP